MQQKQKKQIEQVEYLGRWVPKEHFRAFVYGVDNKMQLARTWDEYQELISSGVWFSTKERVEENTTQPEVKTIEIPEPESINKFKSGRRSRNL